TLMKTIKTSMLVTAAILAASCNPLDTEWDPFSILDPSQGGFGGPGGAIISVTPADRKRGPSYMC
ncbi:MAG: hypothetical protein II172_05545, partial [Bacteroidales bacterium]|nr:hypothetical protein [Bacteroidales bacterium]